jgi:fatty acid desaturase
MPVLTTRADESHHRFERGPVRVLVPRPSQQADSHGGVLMAFLLWILAVILVIAGIVAIFRSQVLWGIVLIIIGLLIGPGGVSVFT